MKERNHEGTRYNSTLLREFKNGRHSPHKNYISADFGSKSLEICGVLWYNKYRIRQYAWLLEKAVAMEVPAIATSVDVEVAIASAIYLNIGGSAFNREWQEVCPIGTEGCGLYQLDFTVQWIIAFLWYFIKHLIIVAVSRKQNCMPRCMMIMCLLGSSTSNVKFLRNKCRIGRKWLSAQRMSRLDRKRIMVMKIQRWYNRVIYDVIIL